MMLSRRDVAIWSGLLFALTMVGYVAAQSNLPAIRVTKSGSESSANVRVGQQLIVSLPVQLGTGFAWNLLDSGDQNPILHVSKVEIGEAADAAPQPGTNEVQNFVLVASRPGQISLDFRLSRERYRLSSADRFKLDVTVR